MDETSSPDTDVPVGITATPRSTTPEAERIVLATLAQHHDSLLRTARRYSISADDAHDAYQRGMEIFLRRATSLEPDRIAGWLHVVVRHEALAVRRGRRDVLPSEDVDLEGRAGADVATPEERLLIADETARATEALKRLKPQERRAMWLKAQGKSYKEIQDETGWTYTKVNRCLAEGRKSFLERYRGIEAGKECERWQPVLSAIIDGEATAAQLADARPHLRNCPACRATIRDLRDAAHRCAALVPLLGVAGLAAEQAPAPSLLARAWDTLLTAVHERALTAAMKVQAVAEATTATKAAAVAASAAAMAGGGAAVMQRAQEDPVPRARAAKVAPAPPAPRTTPVATSAPASAPLPTVPARTARASSSDAASAAAASRRAARARDASAAAVAQEFLENAGRASAASASGPAPARAPAPASLPRNGSEFAP